MGVKEEPFPAWLWEKLNETRGWLCCGWMNQWQIPGRDSSLVVIHQLHRELRVGVGGSAGTGVEFIFIFRSVMIKILSNKTHTTSE